MGLRHILNPLVCYEIRAETLEWDILNPDRLITRGEQALFNLEIRKNMRSNIDLNIRQLRSQKVLASKPFLSHP